jgi:hypothetical protein
VRTSLVNQVYIADSEEEAVAPVSVSPLGNNKRLDKWCRPYDEIALTMKNLISAPARIFIICGCLECKNLLRTSIRQNIFLV